MFILYNLTNKKGEKSCIKRGESYGKYFNW